MVSERAVAQFEKKKKYELDRVSSVSTFFLLRSDTTDAFLFSSFPLSQFDTLASLFETVAEDCNYRLADLIMTNDSKRIYRSTTADTLGIYNDALFSESFFPFLTFLSQKLLLILILLLFLALSRLPKGHLRSRAQKEEGRRGSSARSSRRRR